MAIITLFPVITGSSKNADNARVMEMKKVAKLMHHLECSVDVALISPANFAKVLPNFPLLT